MADPITANSTNTKSSFFKIQSRYADCKRCCHPALDKSTDQSTLACNISWASRYVTPHTCGAMSYRLPISIGRDVLSNVSQVPIKAFEVHGRRVGLKLFEVANLLADVVIC